MYVVDKKSIEVKHNLYVVTFSLEYVGANRKILYILKCLYSDIGLTVVIFVLKFSSGCHLKWDLFDINKLLHEMNIICTLRLETPHN